MALHSSVDKRLHLGRIADVAAHVVRLTSESPNPGLDSATTLFAPAAEHDPCAFPCKRFCGRLADPGSRAGYRHDLPVEPAAWIGPSIVCGRRVERIRQHG